MRELPQTVSREIVATLAEAQADESDRKFAVRLGVTRSHWAHLKAGRREVSYALAKRAAGVFPGVLQTIMRDLSTKEVA